MDPHRAVDAYFEVKKDNGCIDTGPRRTVLAQLTKAQEQLKDLTESKSARARIALCFVTLWRNAKAKSVTSYRSALSEYLKQLKGHHEIAFYAAYLSPEKLVEASRRIDRETVYYPAIVVVGKFV